MQAQQPDVYIITWVAYFLSCCINTGPNQQIVKSNLCSNLIASYLDLERSDWKQGRWVWSTTVFDILFCPSSRKIGRIISTKWSTHVYTIYIQLLHKSLYFVCRLKGRQVGTVQGLATKLCRRRTGYGLVISDAVQYASDIFFFSICMLDLTEISAR